MEVTIWHIFVHLVVAGHGCRTTAMVNRCRHKASILALTAVKLPVHPTPAAENGW
ncbi:MAG: hypothetical protein GX952_00100 [Firmicutes bacterium]|nr:hypothetical protein [Bacillota bacterium]